MTQFSSIVEDGWHGKFDKGKWALVPDKETRDAIVKKLKEIVRKREEVVPEMSEGVNPEENGRESAWPHFTKVSKAISMLITRPHCSTGFRPQEQALPIPIFQCHCPQWSYMDSRREANC